MTQIKAGQIEFNCFENYITYPIIEFIIILFRENGKSYINIYSKCGMNYFKTEGEIIICRIMINLMNEFDLWIALVRSYFQYSCCFDVLIN